MADEGDREEVALSTEDDKLVTEWEKHSGLYITNCDEYRDGGYKSSALKSISEVMGWDGKLLLFPMAFHLFSWLGWLEAVTSLI